MWFWGRNTGLIATGASSQSLQASPSLSCGCPASRSAVVRSGAGAHTTMLQSSLPL